MSKLITHKAQQRVNTQDTSAHKNAQTQENVASDASIDSADTPNDATKASLFSRLTRRWLPRTVEQWWLFVSAVIGFVVLIYVMDIRTEQQWRIEALYRHIQDIEERVEDKINLFKKAQEENKQEIERLFAISQDHNVYFNELTSRVDEIERQLNDESRQPVISQADVQAIKSKVEALQAQLEKMSPDLLQQAQEWLRQFKNQGETSATSPQVQQQLQNLQQKLQQFGAQVQALASTNHDDSQADKVAPLEAEQIQQWVIQVNTEWQLTGQVAQTKAQLRALEQAIGASHLPNKLALMKAIGQDEALLDRYAQQTQRLPDVAPLRAWIKSLARLTPSDKPSSTASSAETITEPVMQGNSLDKLQHKFQSVFSIHKRSEHTALTEAERAVLQQVWVQRGLLLVDQLAWAMQRRDGEALHQAIAQLEQWGADYFPQQQAQLKQYLAPFKALQFHSRPPLHIVEAL